MEIIQGLENLGQKENSVVSLGTFDGIHLGHQKIISTVLEAAKKEKLKSTLVTFDPHPRMVLNSKKDNVTKLLTTTAEKLKLIEEHGIDRVVVINFSNTISNYPYKDFVKDILIDKIGMEHLVIGYDHAFGKDRKGNFDSVLPLSKELGFKLTKVEPYFLEGTAVSSSVVRKYLDLGKVRVASLYLGRFYSLQGRVVHGDGRGKKMSFPTANIEPESENKIIPMNSVYAIDAVVKGERMKAMMNIGYRPTFENRTYTLEANIFGLNEDIYDETITVYFKKRLRHEIKFSSVEELINQLKIDKEDSLKL